MTKPDIPYHLHRPEKDLPIDFDEPCAFIDDALDIACGHPRREHLVLRSGDLAVTTCRACARSFQYIHDFVQGVTRQ